MEVRDIYVGALPDDTVKREVVGYGRIRRASSGATEMKIRVYWAHPRIDGSFDEKQDQDGDPNLRTISRWIGCGMLPLVPVGSRWLGRRKMKDVFMPVKTATAVCVGVETIGRSVSGLGLRHYPFDGDPGTMCFRLQLDGDRRQIAIVPILEVIRAVFGCRSAFLRQLFDGIRDPNLMRGRFLFDRARSRLQGRKAFVACHSKPTEREAWVAAMIVASDVFRAAHDGVFARLQAGGLGAGIERVVETSFPFGDRPIGLSYEERFVHIAPGSQSSVQQDGSVVTLNRNTTGRRLITRILAFDAETAFDEVTYAWPRSRTLKGLPPSSGTTVSSKKRSVVFVEGVVPSTFRKTLTLSVEGAQVMASKGVVFVSEPFIVRDKGESRKSVDPGDGTKASTPDPHRQGDADVAPLELEAKNPSGNPAAGLSQQAVSMVYTDKAVRLLATAREWPASGLASAAGSVPPLVPIEDGKWSMHIVEMEVVTGDGPVLIYELGSTSKAKRALGIVARAGMMPFSDVDRDKVRKQILEWKGHWLRGRSLGGFAVAGLLRPADLWADTHAYADRIESKIDDVIRRAMALPP